MDKVRSDCAQRYKTRQQAKLASESRYLGAGIARELIELASEVGIEEVRDLQPSLAEVSWGLRADKTLSAFLLLSHRSVCSL